MSGVMKSLELCYGMNIWLLIEGPPRPSETVRIQRVVTCQLVVFEDVRRLSARGLKG